MDKFKEIRPIALGLAIKNNKLLVSEGFDKVKNETFDISDDNYQEEYKVIDDHGETIAKWINIQEFKNKSKILYPEDVFKYLD